MTLVWLVAGVLAVLAVLVVLALRRLECDPVSVRRSGALWCPVRGETVTADMRVAAWDGHLMDVERCSVCSQQSAFACDKQCLVSVRDT